MVIKSIAIFYLPEASSKGNSTVDDAEATWQARSQMLVQAPFGCTSTTSPGASQLSFRLCCLDARLVLGPVGAKPDHVARRCTPSVERQPHSVTPYTLIVRAAVAHGPASLCVQTDNRWID